MKRSTVCAIGLLLTAESGALYGITSAAAQADGWITVVDGKEVGQWDKLGEANWHIADGALVAEGAGGVLVPVTREMLFADLFAHWSRPVVLVARTGLGTINHSLLSIEALRSRGVSILGVAFVGEGVEDSEATIAAIGKVKRLGRLPRLATLNRETLAQAFAANFDVEDFR